MFRFIFKVAPALQEGKDYAASYILPVLWARIFMSPREFIYVIRYTCAWIHTAFCTQAGRTCFAHTPHWSKSYGNAITRCWVATNIIYFSKTLISWAQPCTKMTALDPTWSWLVLGQFRAQYFLKTGLTFHPIGFWLLLMRFIRFR